MSDHPRQWYYFLLRMAVPALAAIAFFIGMFFFMIIPAFEKALMHERQETTKQLTQTALSVLEDMEREVNEGKLDLESAQEIASAVIRTMRYGQDNYGYFWVLDHHPIMIAHPHRRDLEGKDVSDYEDLNGKKLFYQFTQVVKASGSGYVRYMWQRMERGEEKLVPKLSYVKGFEPWGWIVGTGIYIDDVNKDIHTLIENILVISIGIVFVVGGVVIFIVFQGVNIEKARQQAERNLVASKDKYHALVEAATDGFIMLLENREMVTNKTIVSMLGYTDQEFRLLSLFDILDEGVNGEGCSSSRHIEALLSGQTAPSEFEARLLRKDGQTVDVIITSSSIDLAGQQAIIMIARDISGLRQMERRRADEERDAIIAELQSSLNFLNLGIKDLAHDVVTCDANMSIRRVAMLMSQKQCEAVLVTSQEGEFLGIVTNHDMRERVVANQANPDAKVISIMTAPVISVSERALVFEAALVMHDENISSLAVSDSSGALTGMISRSDLLKLQGYSAVSLIQSIQVAETPEEIAVRREKLPVLVKAILDSGSQPQNVTRIISNLSDVSIRKLIKLAISELGEPPVPFAFVVMGSVGREEQTLCTDQDNAIIYADHLSADQSDEVQRYFLALSRKVCGWLDQVGYAYCPGNIMASNPDWCQPLEKWKGYFTSWMASAGPQQLLEINIFFDFRAVFGEKALVDELRYHIQSTWPHYPFFISLLAENAFRYRPPMRIFGTLISSSSEQQSVFDVKDALMPIVNIARAQALKHHITETNTLERVQRLYELGVMDEHEYSEILLVYNFLMQLRLKQQAIAAKTGGNINNLINLKSMTEIEQMTLKNVFNKTNEFLAQLKQEFSSKIN
jgi:PAS domain S-box-containing protein